MDNLSKIDALRRARKCILISDKCATLGDKVVWLRRARLYLDTALERSVCRPKTH